MYELNSDGSIKDNTLCIIDPPDTNYGCTWTSASPYPYATNPATVPIETDYLLDVVPQEMGPYYHPTAIQALATAARSYIMYHINNSPSIDNSTNFQVFIPYKFESLNSNDQLIIQNAVAPRYYVARSDTDLPAFAEYFADIQGATVSGDKPYLTAVIDDISTAYQACDASNDGHGRGLSQKGASRWARGNKCSYAGAGDQPWSVRWDDVRQILVHYYTGVHILDANNNNAILTPDDRWNLLQYVSRLPPSMAKGSTYDITFDLQNTSTWDWTTSNAVFLRLPMDSARRSTYG